MSELNVEEGKRYRRGDGGVTGPLRRNAHAVDVTSEYTDGIGEWSKSGRWSVLNNTEYDLVEEYVEAEPLKWKRGIPTEEECRECWLIDGLSGPQPCCHSTGDVYQPGGTSPDDWDGREWYIALRIKPVEPPKPKMVRKWTLANGAELWWPEDDPMIWTCWIRTDEVRPS